MQRPRGIRRNRYEEIKDRECFGNLVSGNSVQCQRLFHLKMGRPQGCEAAHGSRATSIPWTCLMLLRLASMGAGAKREATGFCHCSVQRMEKVRRSRGQMVKPPLFPLASSTLWGSRSSPVGLFISFTTGSCRVEVAETLMVYLLGKLSA